MPSSSAVNTEDGGSPRAVVWAGRIMSTENFSDLIGNQTRVLPACIGIIKINYYKHRVRATTLLFSEEITFKIY
jgi:hypothetical protein